MVNRAAYHGFVEGKTSEIIKKLKEKETYKKIAKDIVCELKRYDKDNIEKLSKNAFGYLFTKEIEKTISKLEVKYSFDDIKNDIYVGNMSEIDNKKLQRAYKYGKQFYKDFSNYHLNVDNKEIYLNEMIDVLSFVQAIGSYVAFDYMKIGLV